jgi:hypothetical protein
MVESIKPDPKPLQIGRSRVSFPFTIAVGLFIVSLIYIPQWKHYAPTLTVPGSTPPYLTPWTVMFVMMLSVALGLLCAPFREQHTGLIILSKSLSAIVGCFSVVFLLEYATGIRFPDLNTFFLSDASGQQVVLHAARPSLHSAITSLCFATAFLLFRNGSVWRKRLYQLMVVAALLLPTVAGIRYVSEFFFAGHALAIPKLGLSLPATMLYYLLGSGALGLGAGLKIGKTADTRLDRRFVRPI